MKALLQRVKNTKVTVDGSCVSSIGKGLLILLGVLKGDSEADVLKLSKKCVDLRIFEDDAQKMNRSILEVDGEALVVSQFTLAADCRRGRRPSFDNAAVPDEAKRLYEVFCYSLKELGVKSVQTGIFAAHMEVELTNDGPVTIMLDSKYEA